MIMASLPREIGKGHWRRLLEACSYSAEGSTNANSRLILTRIQMEILIKCMVVNTNF